MAKEIRYYINQQDKWELTIGRMNGDFSHLTRGRMIYSQSFYIQSHLPLVAATVDAGIFIINAWVAVMWSSFYRFGELLYANSLKSQVSTINIKNIDGKLDKESFF